MQTEVDFRFYFMKCALVLLTMLFYLPVHSQSPNQVINTVNQRFAKVNDYTAAVNVSCDINFIKIDPIDAKVFYKKPDKFKVKATGILIMPKQNVNFYFTTLADTANYTAVRTGEELVAGAKVQVINVIPLQDSSDLILGKFWIDPVRRLILKSQLTTKSQGTILIENSYGSMSNYALPDKMLFTVDVGKFKIPKAIAADINQSTAGKPAGDGKGRITLSFTNYVVNKGVNNDLFK